MFYFLYVGLFSGTILCSICESWRWVGFLYLADSRMRRIMLNGVLRGFMDPLGSRIGNRFRLSWRRLGRCVAGDFNITRFQRSLVQGVIWIPPWGGFIRWLRSWNWGICLYKGELHVEWRAEQSFEVQIGLVFNFWRVGKFVQWFCSKYAP